ncbi:MAG: SDR family NAD(P)-dependent oxidoreductase [Muribaculaceae bacterium]|nr:SDR family NAD(P)-dependent oxidoreductase [Muribaculaceae bacterium]
MEKKIVIMGATSGLGLNLAKMFVAAGWKVGACGRNESALARLKAQEPSRIVTAAIDITAGDAPERLERLIAELGGMDIYFHGSGILRESDFEATIATNVGGFTRMINAAYDYFSLSRQPARIVAISSIAGTRGLAELACYSATKAYDATFLEAMRQRAHKERLPLRIVDIRPGWTRTPLLDGDKHYLFEMDEETVCCGIFRATLRSRRVAIIGLRWQLLCALQHFVPAWLWERIHLPLWRDGRN